MDDDVHGAHDETANDAGVDPSHTIGEQQTVEPAKAQPQQHSSSPDFERTMKCLRRMKLGWRRSKWHDRVVAVATVVIAGVGIGQFVVYSQMKGLMVSSSGQTDKLIQAAKIQACAAQKIAAASDRNATAAAQFSKSADGINQHTDAAVSKLKDLATATQDAANTVAQTMKIQATPWVSATELSLIEQDPYWGYVRVKMFMANEGSTPAMNLRIVFGTAISEKRYLTKEGFDRMDKFFNSVEFEGSRGIVLPHNSNETPIATLSLSLKQSTSMRSGNYFFFVLAKIKYDDIFGRPIVSTVCDRLDDGKLVSCNIGNNLIVQAQKQK